MNFIVRTATHHRDFIARTGARTDIPVVAPVRITVKPGDAHRTTM
ncbi:hypothetical protein [Streptomyces griseoruber]|nr:hypothetical protein [Streptomyces griseoruber]